MGLESYVYENTLKPILKKKDNGEEYVEKHEFESLDLTPNERVFAENVLKSKNIEIVKTLITEEDRSHKVSETTYGEIKTYELENKDVPKMSEIEYENNEQVFANFQELDEFLESKFIPSKVRYKVSKNKQGTEMPYPSIQYNEIVKLKLSEEEVKHVMEYLDNQGIRVGGISPQLDSEFENYDYTRTYKTIDKVPETLSDVEQELLFKELKETQDINRKNEIREKLILGNMKLARYLAYKASKYYKIDIGELQSYAYEGLIYAVDKFNPDLGNKFSTFAFPCIFGTIQRAVPNNSFLPNHLVFAFEIAKRAVEQEFDRKYTPGDMEMYQEILDLMEYNGDINRSQKHTLLTNGLINTESLEEMLEEKDIAYDPNVAEEAIQSVLSDKVEEVLETLTEREKTVLTLRFGLNGNPPMTLEEIGRHFSVTQERIRQIESKALRKLRHPSRRNQLNGFYNEISSIEPESFNGVQNIVDKEGTHAR